MEIYGQTRLYLDAQALETLRELVAERAEKIRSGEFTAQDGDYAYLLGLDARLDAGQRDIGRQRLAYER